MKRGKGKTPGIKVRVAKGKHVRLVDRRSGEWLASVRWRPEGTMWLELAPCVGKTLVKEPNE